MDPTTSISTVCGGFRRQYVHLWWCRQAQVHANDLQRYNLRNKAYTLTRSMRDGSGLMLIQSPVHGRKYVQLGTFHVAEPLIVPLSLRVKCTCLVVTMEPTGCAIYIPLNLVSLPPCIDCQFLTICMQEYFVQCLWLNYMQLHTQTLQKNETIGSIQRLTSGHSFTANSS